jgi:N-acetyl-anhydromuramyl-L-alanine amidase AmpD
VVIHATVGSEPGTVGAAESTVLFSKRTDRPSSYHYIADALHSLQYVYDKYVAFHAPPNQNSIGYELCCSLTNEGKGHWGDSDHLAMLRICAKDVARLCLAYDVPIVKIGWVALQRGARGICGHNDVRLAFKQTSHWDPGPFFPWKHFINLVAAEADALLAADAKASVTVLKTRGEAIDHAIEDLVRAIKRTEKQSPRRRKLEAALDDLRTIKPKRAA